MTDEDIAKLKDRPFPMQAYVFTDAERDKIGELQAAMHSHINMLLEYVHQDSTGHHVIERRMNRISALAAEIRDIEDAVRERYRVRRNTPPVVDMDALGT